MNACVNDKLLIEKEYREEHRSTMVLRAIWEEFSDRLALESMIISVCANRIPFQAPRIASRRK